MAVAFSDNGAQRIGKGDKHVEVGIVISKAIVISVLHDGHDLKSCVVSLLKMWENIVCKPPNSLGFGINGTHAKMTFVGALSW